MENDNNAYNDGFAPYSDGGSNIQMSEGSGLGDDEYSGNENVRDPNSYGGYTDDDDDDYVDEHEDGVGDDDSYNNYDEYGNDRGDKDYDEDGNYYGDDQEEPDYYDGYPEDYPEEEIYYDEQDEEDRRKTKRLKRVWICCVVMLCCMLVLVIFLIVFLLTREKDKAPTPTPRPTRPPLLDTDDDFFYDDDIILAPGVITTPMAAANRDCEKSEGVTFEGEFRNVVDQCECTGTITGIPQDVQDMRNLIVERVGPKFYGDNFSLPLSSCEPKNMAAIWLATGDNRDAGEPRQRFAMALNYYQLNGTIWDYMDGWMGPLNECLWMGVQCNNRDSVNSLALDANNLFGLVRTRARRNEPTSLPASFLSCQNRARLRKYADSVSFFCLCPSRIGCLIVW